MEKNFKDTNIPQEVSKALSLDNFTLGTMHIELVTRTIMAGISNILKDTKSLEKAVAVVIRKVDGSFLVAAKVEFQEGQEDSAKLSDGGWSYVWTFYEEDIEDATQIDINSASAFAYLVTAAQNVGGFKFESQPTAIRTIETIFDTISHWMDDNATEEEQKLILPGAFFAKFQITNGEVAKSMEPDGEMKTLIKDDDVIQDAM